MHLFQALAFSDLTTLSLSNAKITLKGFSWTEDGEEAARKAGQAWIHGAPTVDDTKKQLGNIYKVVAMEVSPFVSMPQQVLTHHTGGSRVSDGHRLPAFAHEFEPRVPGGWSCHCTRISYRPNAHGIEWYSIQRSCRLLVGICSNFVSK